MNNLKQLLFIKAILAEESLNRSIMIKGEGIETHLNRQNYENMLELIEKSGWYEEYRSFKIMAVLCFARKNPFEQKILARRVL